MAHKVRIYPHNDLYNLAHFNLEIINTNKDNGKFEGMALYCMNCLIALAFSTEALINFIGYKKVKNWSEKANWYKKLGRVCAAIGYSFDLDNEPFKTLEIIKNIRNDLAHGKPIEKTINASNKEELMSGIDATWYEYSNPGFTSKAYEQAKAFKKELILKSGLSLGETLTFGIGWYEKA